MLTLERGGSGGEYFHPAREGITNIACPEDEISTSSTSCALRRENWSWDAELEARAAGLTSRVAAGTRLGLADDTGCLPHTSTSLALSCFAQM